MSKRIKNCNFSRKTAENENHMMIFVVVEKTDQY